MPTCGRFHPRVLKFSLPLTSFTPGDEARLTLYNFNLLTFVHSDTLYEYSQWSNLKGSQWNSLIYVWLIFWWKCIDLLIGWIVTHFNCILVFVVVATRQNIRIVNIHKHELLFRKLTCFWNKMLCASRNIYQLSGSLVKAYYGSKNGCNYLNFQSTVVFITDGGNSIDKVNWWSIAIN